LDEITWNEVICLIDRIVHEIRMALSHELYLSALALALTLPDTCGKAEYPNEDYNGVRYKNWCSQYVITDRCDSPYGQEFLKFKYINSSWLSNEYASSIGVPISSGQYAWASFDKFPDNLLFLESTVRFE
jgi:hypothetical protein